MATSSLGTAWIQIKPSLSGVSNSLKKEFAGAGESAGSVFNTSFAAKFGAISGVVSSITSRVSSLISQNLSKAISRVDTLNNFPRVMSNLNVSVEDSTKAIQKMSEKLQGLPTSLDSGAAAVQRFTSKNNDVSKSTDYFLALNNALLAGGMATEIQASALEQLSQAYAKGKPDMMEWRSLLTAMPAQLNQIAQEMGYGANGADALGEALRNGDESMERFMNTIVKLNTEGSNGFASFETQAKDSTGGIQTAIDVMNSRITQGIAAVIDTIGQERISEIAVAIGNAFKQAGIAIAGAVGFVIDHWGTIAPILGVVGSFAGTIWAIITALKAYHNIVTAVTAVTKLWGIIMRANPIGLIITAIAAVTAALVYFFTQTEVGREIIGRVAEFIGNVFEGIANFFKGWFDSWKNMWETIGNVIGTVIGTIVEFFKNLFATIGGIISNWFNTWVAIYKGIAQWIYDNVISPIIEFIKGVVEFIKNIIIVITAVLATIAQWIYEHVIQPVVDFVVGLWNTVSEIISSVVETIKNIVGEIVAWINDNIITPISEFFTGLWNGITEGVSNAVTAVTEFFTNLWNKITEGVKSAFDTVKSIVGGVAQWIYEHVIQPVAGFFSKLWEGITKGIEALKSGIKTAFETIGNFIKTPINAIINAINGVIDGINSITVPDWVPVLGGKHANFAHIPTLATGGLVGGIGTETSDSNLFALSKGEYVIRASAARQIGYDNLDRMNKGGAVGNTVTQNISINGYNKDPNELADIISRKIALKTRGVY